MPDKNLIEDVADNIVDLFKQMWPYQDQQSPMKVREHDAMRSLTDDMSANLDATDAATGTPIYSAKDRSRIEEVRREEGLAQLRLEEARLKVREISGKVTDELARLTEDTYPKTHPDTPRLMYEFLEKFGRSYTKAGKQRSAGPLLEYLYSSCDHAYWIWKEWIAACMAVGDLTSAERLLAVLTDGQASSSQAHRFNQEGGRFKPFVVIAKGTIALKRDGDLLLASKYAEVARTQFAEAPESVEFFRRVNYIKKEHDEGRLELEHLATGRNGLAVREQLDHIIPPVALLTGRWDKEEEE